MKPVLYPLIFAIMVLLAWNTATQVFHIPQYLLPAPQKIAQSMLIDRDYFMKHGLITLLEASFGFLLAVLLGFLLGTLFAVFQLMEKMVLPYVIASQAVPIVAVAPLFILWLGNSLASKVAMACLICFFPMVVNTTKGLRSIGSQYTALMRSYSATKWQMFWKLRFPSSLAYVIAGLRISAALAMIGAIVAEYAGADQGLGYVIMQATYRLDSVRLFAGIFYAALGGWLIFSTVLLIEFLFLKRFRTSTDALN